MQSYQWYLNRLQAMSGGEVCWRAFNKIRDLADACRAPWLRRPQALSRLLKDHHQASEVCGHVLRSLPAVGDSDAPVIKPADWQQKLLARAENICSNRLSFLHFNDFDCGPEVLWNYEYEAGRATPLCGSNRIDYRDHDVTGDAKVVWDLNRHQHLMALARAYRLSGSQKYALQVLEHIDSWIAQCPFGVGMNWRSPLELGIRLINWVWALEFIRPSGLIGASFSKRLLSVVHRHIWEIDRKYSRYSSANNHVVGEAAGVFIASNYFQMFKASARWARRSRSVLEREIRQQTLEDGGHCELAMGYHCFVLEFFLLAGLVARGSGRDFSPEYWQHLEGMFEYLAEWSDLPALPMLGDGDDGFVLELGDPCERHREWLAVGAAVFGRPDFKHLAGGQRESGWWLLGKQAVNADESGDAIGGSPRPSRALPASGYYIMRAARPHSAVPIQVMFDCGELGFGPLAAHGHADALSFTLNAFGIEVLIDPGTYDYFTYPQYRDYFRSTRAHNTIVVDGADQSEMLGGFLWGRRANCRCTEWRVTERAVVAKGEHDGYSRLPSPVCHRRSLTLDRRDLTVLVEDDLIGAGSHGSAFYLHFAEHCDVQAAGGGVFHVDCGAGQVTIEMDTTLEVHAYKGSEQPIAGWASRGYHRKQPCTTLVGRCAFADRLHLTTNIRVSETFPKRANSDVSGHVLLHDGGSTS